MAKKRSSQQSAADLPGASATITPKVDETVTTAANAKPIEVTSSTLQISVPQIDGVQGYCRRRVDVTLTGSQAKKLKGMLMGLEANNAKLENGRFVTTPQHAMQWVIENLG